MSDYTEVPAGCDWSPSITQAELEEVLDRTHSRLISIHRPDPARDEFAAVWVENVDDLAWGWTPGTSSHELRTLDHAAWRLVHVDLVSLDVSDPLQPDVEIAAVWVDNTGPHHRDWDWAVVTDTGYLYRYLGDDGRLISLSSMSVVIPGTTDEVVVWCGSWIVDPGRRWDWLPGATYEEMRQALEDSQGGRLVTVDSFAHHGETRFAVAWVDNSGGPGYWWGVGQDADTIRLEMPLYCSYMVEARTLPGDTAHFIHVRHGYPREDYVESAPLIELRGSAEVIDVTTSADMFTQESRLDLTIENVSGQDVDIEEADVIRSYSGWFWLDEPGRLMRAFDPATGMFGSDSAHMTSGASYTRSHTDWEKGFTHYLVRVRARAADGRRQRVAVAIPIVRTPLPAPPAMTADVPVLMGLWSDPLDIVDLVHPDGRRNPWLTLGGSITNWSDEIVQVGGFKALVKDRHGTILVERELTHTFRELHWNDWPTLPAPERSYADIDRPYTVFIDGIDLDGLEFDGALHVRLTFDYKLKSGWCGSVTRELSAARVPTSRLQSPLAGSLNFGNAMEHLGFDTHGHWHERYSYDMGVFEDDALQSGPDDVAESYYCYARDVTACMDGTILKADYSHPEHAPNSTPRPDANEVVIEHDDGTVMRFTHLHSHHPDFDGHPLQVGDHVPAGTVVGRVGNSGTDVPHLHFDLWGLSWTGHPRPLPMIFTDLELDGDHYSTPASGRFEVT